MEPHLDGEAAPRPDEGQRQTARFHEPAPVLLINIGCQGRGLGLQSAISRAIAAYLATGNADGRSLPLTPIAPLPLHARHPLYVSAIIAWYRLGDGGIRQRNVRPSFPL